MKISIPLRFKILHQPKYALVFYMDFFFKQNAQFSALFSSFYIIILKIGKDINVKNLIIAKER